MANYESVHRPSTILSFPESSTKYAAWAEVQIANTNGLQIAPDSSLPRPTEPHQPSYDCIESERLDWMTSLTA